MTPFRDSLGIAHLLPEPLLKAGIHAPAEPPPGAFRQLVDELVAFRERRRRMTEKVKVPTNTRDQKAERETEAVSRADHLPAIRQPPARPAKPATEKPLLRKSLADLARETERMAAESQRATAELQRDTALAMIADLTAAARAGKLGSIEAAKLDAIAHRHARELGMETTGVRG